jgi:leucyl-tRNA synthetase
LHHRRRCLWSSDISEAAQTLRKQIHQTIRKVSDDIDRRMQMNTAIASVMELMNAVSRFEPATDTDRGVVHDALNTACLLLTPVVPHITAELWLALGNENDILNAAWPEVDESALVEDEIQYILQVNGKLRDRIMVPATAAKDDIEKLAMASDGVQRNIEGKTVRKVIVVPGRLVNVVAN